MVLKVFGGPLPLGKWSLKPGTLPKLLGQRYLTLGQLRAQDPSNSKKNVHPMDIGQPARFYPEARKLRRKVFLHIGPTNSGKSYTALQAFKKASAGFYAGPLRMLAREVYDRMEAEGIPCNLITGDERIDKHDKDGKLAGLSCGTIEMTDLNTELDVAVIDEIQMINDPDRGWAWTKALLGVRAHQVHLCGDANSENIVKQLMMQTGDELEVVRYKRLSGLEMDASNMTTAELIKSLQPGDCVVCFTKKNVQAVRDRIIHVHKKPCAVIYGSLPPEVRAEQARLFNDPKSGVDFLVASDAIGMGLNLAIRRVIFTTLKKFDGEQIIQLPIPQIKQIAGRAGRFRVANEVVSDGKPAVKEVGLVNAVSGTDKSIIAKALRTDSPAITFATIWPSTQVIEASSIDKGLKFSEVLDQSFELAKIGPGYSRPRSGNIANIARLYDNVRGLTFQDKMKLSNAPVSDDPTIKRAFTRMCETVGSGISRNVLEISANIVKTIESPTAPTAELEVIHKIFTLFLWLSYRFPCNFIDREGAHELKKRCETKINSRLLSRKQLHVAKPRKSFGGKVRKTPFEVS